MTADSPTPAVSCCSGRNTWFRFLCYTALLFASWNYNLLGLPDGVFWSRDEVRAGYLGSESHLVVMRLAQPDLHPLHPLTGSAPDGRFIPYPSQVGLTGIALGAAKRVASLPPGPFVMAAAAALAGLSALVLAAVLATAQRWVGAPTGDVACLLAASTPIFLPFTPSLYWVPSLLLLPFAVVWCLYPRTGSRRGRIALLAGVAVGVMLKSLCGYEYITAVILAPLAAAWFHQCRSGELLFRQLWINAALLGAGLLGFAAAMLLHIGQQELVLGQNGVSVIRDRAIARTASNPEGEIAASGGEGVSGSRWENASRCFLSYFDQRTVSVAGGFGRLRKDVPLGALVAITAALIIATALARRHLPRDARALAGAAAIGLAASLSWQVLAINHMCVHRHLNLVVFSIPFLPLAYLAIGYAVELLTGQRLGARFGAILLAGTAAVMIVNGVMAGRTEVVEKARQAAAEEAVAARLGSTIPPPMADLGGGIDRVRTMADVPAAILMEYGLIDLATGRPVDPTALVIEGWVLGECRTTAQPTSWVVVACGGAVTPCQVLRFRRPDIERLIGRPVPGTGFVAIIPSTAMNPGEDLRVFAADNEGKVVELALRGRAAAP